MAKKGLKPKKGLKLHGADKVVFKSVVEKLSGAFPVGTWICRNDCNQGHINISLDKLMKDPAKTFAGHGSANGGYWIGISDSTSKA